MRATPLTPDQRATRLASRQYGLLTHLDALACGLTERQILRRARSGRWTRVARGLYRIAGAPDAWRADALAGCLLVRPGGVASHLTAAALHGWGSPPLLPHVSAPTAASARTLLCRVHRSTVPAVDRTRIDGVPCTSASRTLVDCAALVDRAALEAMVDDALCSGLATSESVLAVVERAGRQGRRGIGLLGSVLEVWTGDIRPGSPAEMRFVRRLEEWGCRQVVTQHEVSDASGGFVARLDVALADRLVGFEYDSDRFHNPRFWPAEELRLARLKALGWRIEHASKLDLLPSATRIPELLARLAA